MEKHELPQDGIDDFDTDSCAIGRFNQGSDPFSELVSVLSETNAEVQAERLRSLGVTDGSFASALRRSCSVCQRGALLYPRTEELAVSFNGGKDACAVLYLWLASVAVLEKKATAKDLPVVPQQVIFFDSPDEFTSVRSFVSWVIQRLGLKSIVLKEHSFKKGMEDLVSNGLRAVVMGQRRGDPWTDRMDVFSPSDDGWPPFMRINPILDWTYSQIWDFLRVFGLPYCNLYNEGYTSLGTVQSTAKNPALLRPNGSYAPAYELVDGSLERSGRDVKNGGPVKAVANVNEAPDHTKEVEKTTSWTAKRPADTIVLDLGTYAPTPLLDDNARTLVKMSYEDLEADHLVLRTA